MPPESALRTALLAAAIARAARLPATDVADAYWAGLFRYLGCSVFAHAGSSGPPGSPPGVGSAKTLTAGDYHAARVTVNGQGLSRRTPALRPSTRS